MPTSAASESAESLYVRLARPMWAVLYARCSDSHMALDAVHEAFVRWREKACQEIRDPDAWLLRVAINWLTDQSRKHRPKLDCSAVEHARDHSDPAFMVERAELNALVRHAIAELRLEDREVLVLKYAMEWPSARIGDVLGITTEAVDMRLSRARRRLAESLAERGVKDVGTPQQAVC